MLMKGVDMSWVINFIAGLFIIFLSNASRAVEPNMWAKAVELCSNNEGILKLEPGIQLDVAQYRVFTVECNNGAKFSEKIKR